MDFHQAAVASAFRTAAEDLERRYARTPRTLASLRYEIAVACTGLRHAWQTEIPAELLHGFLRAGSR